jgi:hypothetical protein
MTILAFHRMSQLKVHLLNSLYFRPGFARLAIRGLWGAMGFISRYILISPLLLAGCQTIRDRNMELVQDRAQKLLPLSRFRTTWCEVEAKPTEPALARYRQLFPKEKSMLEKNESWVYTWHASENSCEIRALESSEAIKNHIAFVETALCLLLQAHWVNSPFDDLHVEPKDLVRLEDKVQIRTSPASPELGIWLEPKEFVVESRTKSHGDLKATYGQPVADEWLPTRIEQTKDKTSVLVDEIDYKKTKDGKRRLISSLWISVGDDKVAPVRHTQLEFFNCNVLQ